MEEYKLFEEGELESLRKREDEENKDSTDSVIPPPDIVAFNEQRSCADIYRMYQKDQIDINLDFQRGEVWTPKSQTLFIDSLMKQLPIPSMCISYDINTHKRLVIDGLQRITSIIKFLDVDKDWKLSKSDDVDSRISGKPVSEIRKNYSGLIDILENVTIPITVIRCDYKNQNHMKYLFQIFHRLNSGGNKLYNQEIRNCIFQGPFNNLLKEIARTESWMTFANTDQKRVEKARFSNEERILRFFAFYEQRDEYSGKLAEFLNKYMDDKKDASDDIIESYRNLIENTLSVANKIGEKINSRNVADAILVGIAQNIDALSMESPEELRHRYSKVMESDDFSEESLSEGLGSSDKVKNRIKKAIECFGNG